MNAWILILTLMPGGNPDSGSAIGSVHGFQNETACQEAKQKWLEEMNHGAAPDSRAICVPTGETSGGVSKR